MSLEARIELLTAAVIELTAAIGAMQTPGPDTVVRKTYGTAQVFETEKEMVEAITGRKKDIPNVQPSSPDTTSGKPSAPTGESSSPALDYKKDVKPITIRLSKEKGREITIAVLSRFGVKSAQDLDAAQWADYIAHCEKVLAGGEV